MEEKDLPKIGISIGDINGIGPEVIIKALVATKLNKSFIPIIYGSGKHLSKIKATIGFNEWQFTTIKYANQASPKHTSLINCLNQEYFELDFGKPTKEAGRLSFSSLERAVNDLQKGEIDALVTAPINKDTIQSENFKFPGHTEYLANAFGNEEVLMFMVSENLKLGVVTGHIPLGKVRSSITKEAIQKKLALMLHSLKNDFDIAKPKIAVLGLNPHAGENGLLGKEEKEIIEPALEDFKKKGELIFGPYATDGFFATGNYKNFDAVLAMYHDQGLTPFKMLAFEDGVNFTAGMPMVRTSPDHGTAYDIVGKNLASPSSLLNAIYTAIDIVKVRKDKQEIAENALNFEDIKKELSKQAKTVQ